MDNFLSSFSKWLGEKANSPLYWTYFGFFVAWNWTFFQIVFLEDASLFTAPRVEYLNTALFAPSEVVVFNWVVNLTWHIVPPVAFTYIATVYLPRLHKWAFEIHLTHYFDRKALFQEHKAEYEKKMAKLTKQEADAKKERAKQEKVIERTKTQDEKWEQDFKDFSVDRKNIEALKEAKRAIYETGGEYSGGTNWMGDLNITSVNADYISRLDTNGLIEISKGRYDRHMKFTEKGKFFVNFARKRLAL